MAERAHPDDPGFQDYYETKRIFGLFKVKRKISNPYREALFWRYSLVNKYCKSQRVLDIPCGAGWGTHMLEGCRELYGVDISQEAINDANQRYGDYADFRQGSMERLEFDNESIDLVSCLEGIEHVSKAIGKSFLAETRRVLSPNGRLILSSPHCNSAPHSGNPYHVYEYPPDEMRSLLSEYFVIEKEESKIVDDLTMTVFYTTKKA